MWRKPSAPSLLLLLLLIALAVLPAHADKKKPRQEFIRPNQVFEIPDAAKTFGVAPRGCANDVWATAVAAVLHIQKVDLPQKDWSIKLAGGDACLSALPRLEILTRSVNGDYPLGNGQQLRLACVTSQGPPKAADGLGVQLASGVPLIVVYKGRPLLLFGMTYDEHIINNLRKELWITELRLIDLAAQPGSEQRVVTIKRDSDDAQNIEAMIAIKVIPMEYGHLEPH